ncbi:MAG: pantoate--beta-alanine ligase [Nitriliruptorales bacterium]|nr:pantoate--beta-alanine ligase [Nitriliruptorales bacterium]
MEVHATVDALRAALRPRRAQGGRIALVPTMGALHEGHLSLVRVAMRRAATVTVSIFVNPLQFGAGEDFTAYPRDLERDLARLKRERVDVVFVPEADGFTRGLRTTVHVAGLTGHLEGASRPGHFDGVTTIVGKLLGAVQPDVAVFGEKDYQQLVIVRRMVRDLDLGVEIVGAPLVREPDGLAASSRNAHLSPDERRSALALSRALSAAREAWGGDAGRARGLLRSRLQKAPGIRLDYAEVVDPSTLEPLEGVVQGSARALVAAFVGRTRLIDNMGLESPGAEPSGRARD